MLIFWGVGWIRVILNLHKILQDFQRPHQQIGSQAEATCSASWARIASSFGKVVVQRPVITAPGIWKMP